MGGYGACAESTTSTFPTSLRFEKATKGQEGFALESLYEGPLSSELVQEYQQFPSALTRGPVCLPWVRVTRDATKYKACLARANQIGPVKGAKKVLALVGDYMKTQDQEVFLVLMLDTHYHVRGLSEIARGSRNRVEVPVPDVFRIVLVEGASGFIVIHNHPSGKTTPSKADKLLTKNLQDASDRVGITMLDHVIVGVDKYYSFDEHGH